MKTTKEDYEAKFKVYKHLLTKKLNDNLISRVAYEFFVKDAFTSFNPTIAQFIKLKFKKIYIRS